MSIEFGPQTDYGRTDGPVGGSKGNQEMEVTQAASLRTAQSVEKVADAVTKHLTEPKAVRKIEKSGFEMSELSGPIAEQVCDELRIPQGQLRQEIRDRVASAMTAYSRSEEERKQEEQKEERSGPSASRGRGKQKEAAETEGEESELSKGTRRRGAAQDKQKLIQELGAEIVTDIKESLLAQGAKNMPASASMFGTSLAQAGEPRVEQARQELGEKSFDKGAPWIDAYSLYGPLAGKGRQGQLT